jgi:micrococcal nuclease
MAQDISATVTHVEDGDTLHVLLHNGAKAKIRFWGIDAPEVCHRSNDPDCRRRPTQPFGPQATERLNQLVHGRSVTLRCNGKQSEGRLVCLVFRGSTDAGLQLVKDGLAHYDPKYLGDPEYADAESSARSRSMGLWQSKTMVLPKVWRNTCWKGGDCPTAAR